VQRRVLGVVGGIFNDRSIANLLLNIAAKNFLNRSIIRHHHNHHFICSKSKTSKRYKKAELTPGLARDRAATWRLSSD